MLSLPSLPGDGNNGRQNCFQGLRIFWGKGMKAETTFRFAFVVPHSVTSHMCFLTGEIVVLFHVLSDVDTETFYRMACSGTQNSQMGENKKKRSINVTLKTE